MATCKGKPVLFLSSRPNIEDEAALSNVWTNYSYHYNSKDCFVLSPLDAIKAKIKSCRGTLKSGDTLYFSKSSEFPRFKLQGSEYKRCIKLDKADCVVVGGLTGNQDNSYVFLEDELNIYCVRPYYTTMVKCSNSAKRAE